MQLVGRDSGARLRRRGSWSSRIIIAMVHFFPKFQAGLLKTCYPLSSFNYPNCSKLLLSQVILCLILKKVHTYTHAHTFTHTRIYTHTTLEVHLPPYCALISFHSTDLEVIFQKFSHDVILELNKDHCSKQVCHNLIPHRGLNALFSATGTILGDAEGSSYAGRAHTTSPDAVCASNVFGQCLL